MKTLKIEMVHDLVCSWCPIGYSHLKQALNKLKVEADIYFLPFELNPTLSPEGESIEDYFARHQGWDIKRLRSYQQSLLTAADKAGVSIDFGKRTAYYNTSLSHRFMHVAQTQGKQGYANELLIDAYFREGINIGGETELLEIAEQLGMNRERTQTELYSPDTTLAVQRKQSRVKALGVSSIPAFVFNDTTFSQGSQSVGEFETLIRSLTIADNDESHSNSTKAH